MIFSADCGPFEFSLCSRVNGLTGPRSLFRSTSLHIGMVICSLGIRRRRLGLFAGKRATLTGSKVAAVTGLVCMEGLALLGQTVLESLEQVVVSLGDSSKGDQSDTSEDK
jgi:hypothetical protein